MFKEFKERREKSKKQRQLKEYRRMLKGEPRTRPAAKTTNIGPG